jgi:hypothetical protein
VEYHVPYTTVVRTPTSCIVSCVVPIDRDRAKVHLCVIGEDDTGEDWADMSPAHAIDSAAWAHACLAPEQGADALIAAYRDAMDRYFPEVLRALVHEN